MAVGRGSLRKNGTDVLNQDLAGGWQKLLVNEIENATAVEGLSS